MKRYILLILCALMLGGVAPHRVWANPQVFDNPGEGGATVGDDDTPIPARSSDPVLVSPRPEARIRGRAADVSTARLALDAIRMKFEPWFAWVRNARDRADGLASTARARR